MRFLPVLLAALVTTLPALAGDPPAYRGFRADLQSADAVLRLRVSGVKPGEKDETRVSGIVERVFKGEGPKPGEEMALTQNTAEYLGRLAGELDCPGGLSADGIHLFAKVPAAGSSCVILARRVKDAWALDACCFAEPAGGLSFTDADQMRAYGEERRKAAALADALVEHYVTAAGASNPDAAVELTVALCSYFAPAGSGDAELAVGVLLDDWNRVWKALPADNARVGEALSRALDGWLAEDGPTTNAARNLEYWLIELLPEAGRKRLMPRLIGDYRAARRKADDLQKRLREPKKHEGKGGDLDTEARDMMTVPAALMAAQVLVARALDPVLPPRDLSADELLEKAEKFANPEQK